MPRPEGPRRFFRLPWRSPPEVGAEVEAAVSFALAGPDPDPTTALADLFADTRAAWSTL